MKWKLKEKEKRNQGHGFLGCNNVSTSTQKKGREKNKCAYFTTVYSTDIICITKQKFLICNMGYK